MKQGATYTCVPGGYVILRYITFERASIKGILRAMPNIYDVDFSVGLLAVNYFSKKLDHRWLTES